MSYSEAFSSKSIISGVGVGVGVDSCRSRGSAGLYYENPTNIPLRSNPTPIANGSSNPISNSPRSQSQPQSQPQPQLQSQPQPQLQSQLQPQIVNTKTEPFVDPTPNLISTNTHTHTHNTIKENNIIAYAGGGLLLLFMIELIFNLGRNSR
jgi:hypothetical protein